MSVKTLATRSLPIRLLPIASVMFVTFLVIGMAMPVLPLHVHQRLSLGAFVVGLVSGSQFTASLISRFWGGRFADTRGVKLGVLTGLLIAASSGLIYLASLRFLNAPIVSASILILGRGVLGVAESFIATGILSWGLSI